MNVFIIFNSKTNCMEQVKVPRLVTTFWSQENIYFRSMQSRYDIKFTEIYHPEKFIYITAFVRNNYEYSKDSSVISTVVAHSYIWQYLHFLLTKKKPNNCLFLLRLVKSTHSERRKKKKIHTLASIKIFFKKNRILNTLTWRTVAKVNSSYFYRHLFATTFVWNSLTIQNYAIINQQTSRSVRSANCR